jgi:hypothetical protein
MTYLTILFLALSLSTPILNQLVVRESLDSMGVWDLVYAEKDVWPVSAFLCPSFETTPDKIRGPANFDVARRRVPMIDVKRAGLEVSLFASLKALKEFAGNGVTKTRFFYVGLEFRQWWLRKRCRLV